MKIMKPLYYVPSSTGLSNMRPVELHDVAHSYFDMHKVLLSFFQNTPTNILAEY